MPSCRWQHPHRRVKITRFLSNLSVAEYSHSKAATSVALVAAVAMALAHIFQTQFFFLPAGQFKNLHLGMAILVVLLTLIERTAPERVWSRRWLALLAETLLGDRRRIRPTGSRRERKAA